MPTQKDVAKTAGVSVATVSRFINKKGYISPQVEARIKEAILRLRYRPNLVARSLKLRSSNTIGLIFPDIENPFFIAVVKKAEEVARRYGYTVILCNTENRPAGEIEYVDVLKGKLVDGYVIIPSISTGTALRDALVGEKVVFLDRSVGDGHDDIVVKLDNRRGVRVAIEYLAGLGHRRIGTIGVPVTITPGAERLEGYRAAVHAHGLDADPSLVRYADFTVESAFRETKALLSLPRRPTALLPLSGPTTVGALKAIMEAHLTVPRDLSVIGFDEFEYAELLSPPLTTIAQPAYEFGTVGVELLVRLLQGKRIRQRTVVLEPTLIERLSCAPTSGDRT